MLKVMICDCKGNSLPLEVQDNITIGKLNEKLCKTIGSFKENLFKYNGEILQYKFTLSSCGIEDGDSILVNTLISRGTHICPYGCKRQIPDEYNGCTELLKDKPHYFD